MLDTPASGLTWYRSGGQSAPAGASFYALIAPGFWPFLTYWADIRLRKARNRRGQRRPQAGAAPQDFVRHRAVVLALCLT